MPAEELHRSVRLGAEYEAVRDSELARLSLLRGDLRVRLGPEMTVVWESREMLIGAAQEALRADRVAEPAAARAELDAFAPLLPDEDELVALLYIEAVDAAEQRLLASDLAGVERTVSLHVGDRTITPVLTDELPGDVEAITSAEAPPAVHVLRYRLTKEERHALAQGTDAALSIDRAGRRLQTPLTDTQRAALVALLEDSPGSVSSL